MPPRLPSLAGVRSILSKQQSSARAFSATSSTASPPREGPVSHSQQPPQQPQQQQHHNQRQHTPSSTSSLLSLNKSKPRFQPRSGGNQGGYGGYGGNKARGPNGGSGRASDAAQLLLSRFGNRASQYAQRSQATADSLREQKVSADYLREMPRKWQPGDVYSPHDLSPVEMMKWRGRAKRKGDIIDALALRPLDMYKNFSMLSDFTNASGQILHSEKTGLRPVNQRKIAKMIRRAQGMGIYPSIHGHPEMIREMFFPFNNSLMR